MWVEPDVRDEIISFVRFVVSMSALSTRKLLQLVGIPSSRFYDWIKRQGCVNRHNGKIPRGHWILDEERNAIITYCRDKVLLGYRRLTYMMIDEDIAYVCPATTYRVLRKAGLLNRWAMPGPSRKGTGFIQPETIHQHWHTDISYVNILGTFYFLISVLDGHSRYILHHELRARMQEYDVELVIRRAKEKYPEASATLISDHGPQYISKDFKTYIRESGLQHVLISAGYPQSNGKMERFYRTLKSEKIRQSSFVDISDARAQIQEYVTYYNEKRLHSGIYYLTPKEVLEGKMKQRLAERQVKLDNARRTRREVARRAASQTTLNQIPCLSISR